MTGFDWGLVMNVVTKLLAANVTYTYNDPLTEESKLDGADRPGEGAGRDAWDALLAIRNNERMPIELSNPHLFDDLLPEPDVRVLKAKLTVHQMAGVVTGSNYRNMNTVPLFQNIPNPNVASNTYCCEELRERPNNFGRANHFYLKGKFYAFVDGFPMGRKYHLIRDVLLKASPLFVAYDGVDLRTIAYEADRILIVLDAVL